MNSIKKLIGVASEKLNLNDVKLSDTIISPDDFLQVYDRATFEDTAVISGRIDSTAQGVDLLDAATIPLNGVLLKNELVQFDQMLNIGDFVSKWNIPF